MGETMPSLINVATISPQAVRKTIIVPQTQIREDEPRSIPKTTVDQSRIDGTYLLEQDDGSGIWVTKKYLKAIIKAIEEHESRKKGKKS